MQLKKITLRVAIFAVMFSLVTLMTVVHGLLGYVENQLTFDEYSSTLFRQQKQIISQALLQKFSVQSNLDELAAVSIGDLYESGGMDLVDTYLLNNLEFFDEVSATFFSTTSNEFSGYLRQQQYLHMYANANTDFAIHFASVNEDGSDGEIQNKKAGFYANQRPWYLSALSESQSGFSAVFTYHAYSTLALPHSLPVYSSTGQLLGVVGSNIFLGQFGGFLQEQMQPFNGVTVIADANGHLIASSLDVSPLIAQEDRSQMILLGDSDNEFVRASKDIAIIGDSTKRDTVLAKIVVNDTEYSVAAFNFDSMKNLSWKVIVFIPDQVFHTTVTQLWWQIGLAILFSLLVTTMFALRLSRALSQPITNLTSRFSTHTHDSSSVPSSNEAVFNLQEVADLKTSIDVYEEQITIWRRLFEASRIAIAVSFQNNEYVDTVNPAFATMFGGEPKDHAGSSISQFYPENPPIPAEELLRRVNEEGGLTLEVENRRGNGERFPCLLTVTLIRDDTGKVLARVAMLSDLTESRQLQQELFQSQKMHAIGSLAGGIVHDMNNVLSAVLNNAELGLVHCDKLSANDKTQFQALFSGIQNAALRGAKLAQQIMSFSRMETINSAPVPILALVTETLELVEPTMSSGITLSFSHTLSEQDAIMGNESQLQQVLLNLLNNSVKAIQKTKFKHGDITVNADIEPDGTLHIAISDNGCGIADDQLPFIFDPFYTTQAKGKGTGLGLAIVERIVAAHKGDIKVSSITDKGTRFDLRFPDAFQSEPDEPCPDDCKPQVQEQCHIVVVDDEHAILSVWQQLLELEGFKVSVFSSSTQALQYCRDNHQHIDCLFTDFDMPTMDGEELISEIRRFDSSMLIVLATGYSEVLSEEKIKTLNIAKLLYKPIKFKDLVAELHQLFVSQQANNV